MQPNGIGVEMLNLGKSDAIFVGLTDHYGNEALFLIDGGGKSDPVEVQSIYNAYHKSSSVFIVVSTHADSDHINGLSSIVSYAQNPTKIILQNAPSDFNDLFSMQLASKRLHGADEQESFNGALERSADLIGAAQRNNFTRYTATASSSPFFNWGGWSAYVVGPERGYIESLYSNTEMFSGMFRRVDGARPHYPNDIDDGSDTSHVNNCSIIILIEGFGQKYLFTGDSGVRSLRAATKYKDLSNLTLLDVPHHGSRRNLDTQLIEYFNPQISFISSNGSEKHPGKRTIHSLKTAGSAVCSTCKQNEEITGIYHNVNRPRTNYNLPLIFW